MPLPATTPGTPASATSAESDRSGFGTLWVFPTPRRCQRSAVANGLVAQADAARIDHPRTALLLGIAAQRIHADAETQASLVNTLTNPLYEGTLSGHTGPVLTVGFSADGAR